MKKNNIMIRKAKMADAKSIHALLNHFADQRELLPRSISEIYENLQQFFVALDGKKVVGCCALYTTWEDLAEVKALAVKTSHQGQGIGKSLLKKAVQEAKSLGVKTLFTLTIRENLFKKFGFIKTNKSQLPHKVWTECVRCPYFPDACIETSLTLDISGKKKKGHRYPAVKKFMSTSDPTVPSEPQGTPSWPPPIPQRTP